jgi:hypothetical protein
MDAVFWSSAFASSGLVAIPSTKTVMLQPVPLQIDTTTDLWQFNPTASGSDDTSTSWREVPDPTSGLKVLEMPDATAGRSFSAISLFDTPEDACFYLNIYRGEASADAVRGPADYYTQVYIADGVVGGLRINLPYGSAPSVDMITGFDSNDNPFYVEVARAGDAIPDCEQYLAGQGDRMWRLRVLVQPAEGACIIDIGQGDATLVIRMDGFYLPQGPLTVVGKNGAARVQFQPMRFNPLGSIISSIRDHGRKIQTEAQASVDAVYNKNIHTVTIEPEVLFGSSTRYAITLDATGDVDSSGLALSSPVVRSATIRFPGITYNDWVTGLAELNMRRVNEELVFDLPTMSYNQVARITCDNHKGLWTGSSGLRAAYLDAGIDGDNRRRITGWLCGIEHMRNDPVRETTFTVYGKEYWLKRKQVGIIEPLDGWDIYAAFRFLAQRAGITDFWLQALPWVEFGRGVPSPFYHLPVGVGVQGALFQFDPRTSIWQCMQTLARYIKAYIGFDVNGFFHVTKWDRDNFGGWKQAFDVAPLTYNGDLLYNQLKRTVSTSVDLSDIRSDIVLGSIDPFTRLPVFANYHNEDVITDVTSWNFIGNEDVEIEVDKMLFDSVIQDETLDSLAFHASLPTFSVNLDAYYQHRLLPLDVITVREEYCVGGIQPFWVERMSSRFGVNNQSHFGDTSLSGRWLYNQ